MANPLISHVTLPGGTYDISDAYAREQIAALSGSTTKVMSYVGVTTTVLKDKTAASPIIIDGDSYTPKAGDVAIYDEKEFIYSDTDKKWHEFGSTGSLKAMAFVDHGTASYKPAGTVSKPTFTGSAVDVSLTGSVPAHNATISTAKPSTGSTANYTPAGSINTPDITVTLNQSSIKPFGTAGTLASCTMPVFNPTVANETLSFGWVDGSYTAGTLPTAGMAVTVATSVKSATSGALTFTGEGTVISSSALAQDITVSGNVTAAGNVSQPTFSGTQATITVDPKTT